MLQKAVYDRNPFSAGSGSKLSVKEGASIASPETPAKTSAGECLMLGRIKII